jgi:hypothetical protein
MLWPWKGTRGSQCLEAARCKARLAAALCRCCQAGKDVADQVVSCPGMCAALQQVLDTAPPGTNAGKRGASAARLECSPVASSFNSLQCTAGHYYGISILGTAIAPGCHACEFGLLLSAFGTPHMTSSAVQPSVAPTVNVSREVCLCVSADAADAACYAARPRALRLLRQLAQASKLAARTLLEAGEPGLQRRCQPVASQPAKSVETEQQQLCSFCDDSSPVFMQSYCNPPKCLSPLCWAIEA